MSKKKSRQARILQMRTDYVLILVVAVLLILGIMMVYSSTYDMAYRQYDGKANYFLVRQLVWTGLGLAGLVALARIDYHLWERWAVPIMAATLVLLAFVSLRGSTKFGAQRWLSNGSIQPSELVKISVVIYISAWVTSKGDKIRKISYGLIPFAILIGLITVLILLQSDLSTALLVVATGAAMFFFAGADPVQLFAFLVFGLATGVAMVLKTEYRRQRIVTFFRPDLDPSGAGFQARQAIMALASGGIFGKGLGESSQKFGYVPTVHTDTIMAVLGEELGLLGCLLLIGLFIAFAYRGLKIALEASDSFGTMLAAGLTCALTLQALANMGVVTGVLPTAGVPLPFISYGGSSMLTSMACVGLLLSVSRGRHAVKGRTSARADVGRGDWRSRISPARNR